MKRVVTFFGRRETSTSSAAFILICMVFASGILGLFRDRLIIAHFGSDAPGVYFAAFRLPNLLFELLVVGALTSAFIPIFTRYISRGGEEDAHRMASSLINLSVPVLLVAALPILIWTPQLSRALAPTFSDAQISDMVLFTRIMIVFQVIPLLIGNFLTGILQSYNSFIMPALAPVVYNVGIIVGVILFSGTYGLLAPVIGVVVGAFLFMLIQIPPLIRLGYRHTFKIDFTHNGVWEVGKLMGPRTLGLAADQIDSTVDLVLASLPGPRTVTIFTLALHLQQLPTRLFGSTIAQAAFPTMTLDSAKENKDHFKETVRKSVHQILFFVLPISVLFIVLRIPIVRLVFGAARFDWPATVLTYLTLSAFSISLPFQAITHVLTRGFYAVYDTKTPVAIGVARVALNTVLSVYFIVIAGLPVWSLGLSASVASIFNACVLFIFLNKKVGGFGWLQLFWPPVKMAVASFAAGVMLYIPLKLFDQLVFDTTRTFGLILLTGTASAIGFLTYFFLSWVLDINEVRSFIQLLSKVRRPKSVILNPAQEVVNSDIGENIA